MHPVSFFDPEESHPFPERERGMVTGLPDMVVLTDRRVAGKDQNGETGFVGQVRIVVVAAAVPVFLTKDSFLFDNLV